MSNEIREGDYGEGDPPGDPDNHRAADTSADRYATQEAQREAQNENLVAGDDHDGHTQSL